MKCRERTMRGRTGGDETAEEGEAPWGHVALGDGALEGSGDAENSPIEQELADGGDAEDGAAHESVRGLELESDGHRGVDWPAARRKRRESGDGG